MAIVLGSYDLPTTNLEAYGLWAMGTVEVVLKAPGLRSFQGFRNLLPNTPGVLLTYDFDTIDNALQFVRSDVYTSLVAEAKALGISNTNISVWDVSPLSPEPLRP